MGVQRLQTYIQKNNLGKDIYLTKEHYKRIIVDGDSIVFYLYEESDLPRIYGGEYFGLRNYLYTFFKKFKQLGFEMMVVFDGIPPNEKRGVINERRKNKCSSSLYLLSQLEQGLNLHKQRVPITRPNCIKNVLSGVLKELKITVQHSFGENDDYIVKLMQENAFDAVLAKDTDFLIYDIKAYIPINQLSIKNNKIKCTIINYNDLCRHFRLQKKFLPLFAYLAGNDISNGSSEIYTIIQKFHHQFKPNILKNIAKQIVFNMQQIMQLLLQDIFLLEGLTKCYNKYNLLCNNNSNFKELPIIYQENFKKMELDSDVVILFLKKTRCFTATFAGLKVFIPKKIQPMRKKFYGVLFGANHKITEHLWDYKDNNINWIKSIVETNDLFAQEEKTLTCFLKCIQLKPTYLNEIPQKLQIVSLAFAILKKYTNYSNEELYCLFYHVCNINTSNTKLNNLTVETPLNETSLEIIDSYIFCITEVLFFNQAFMNIIPSYTLSFYCRASLFYAYHNSKIEIKKNKLNDQIFNYIIDNIPN